MDNFVPEGWIFPPLGTFVPVRCEEERGVWGLAAVLSDSREEKCVFSYIVLCPVLGYTNNLAITVHKPNQLSRSGVKVTHNRSNGKLYFVKSNQQTTLTKCPVTIHRMDV